MVRNNIKEGVLTLQYIHSHTGLGQDHEHIICTIILCDIFGYIGHSVVLKLFSQCKYEKDGVR